MTRSATFVAEFSHRLRGLTESEMVLFTRFTRMFADRYTFAYQICGDIDLVLDNSIIQAFKHRDREPSRALRALAFVAFCRFVTGWSDRPTSLAISPFAIYEHSGRKLVADKHEAGAILRELGTLLAETGLSAAGIGFADTSALFHQLADIQHDEAYLTNYVRAIDAASWETKLSRPFGTLIPFDLALDAMPGNLPLRYFDTRYVRYVFASRIERLIIAHSRRDPGAASVASGPLARALSKLNNFKRGKLQGLGDIDILQICDLARQFQVRTGRILIGQTVDKKLWAALTHTSIFSYRARLHTPADEKKVRQFVDFMLSNPYVEEDQRAQRIEQLTLEFCESLFDACDVALGRHPRGRYRV